MRQRLPTLRPTILALTFVALLAIPAAAAAQAGPQPTIAMQPETAGPGTAVEVSGSGFPAAMALELELKTEAGTFDLATAATARDGTFRQLVVLPALPMAGAWAVVAQAADGTTVSHDFAAKAPAVASVEAPAAARDGTPSATAGASGKSSSDGVFLVIVGCLLGMVSTGALFAWRLLHEERVQPGMGEADDLIWSEGREDESAEPTAISEPFWKNAPSEVEASTHEAEPTTGDVAGSSEQGAPASA